jgi:hypothetical protein
VSVKPQECGIGWLDSHAIMNEYKGCNPVFSEENVDRETLSLKSCLRTSGAGAGTDPRPVSGLKVKYSNNSYMDYKGDHLSGASFSGKFGEYGAGGHTVYFSETANRLLDDPATRAAASKGNFADKPVAAERKARFLDCLKDSNFVDVTTRLLTINFAVLQVQCVMVLVRLSPFLRFSLITSGACLII